ncbi:hypothetical protein SUGI_0499740 [Cryptomeria japonica]|nr:hypothetical protein SUGI_0499740 [Cryptomeria japonica]
MAEQLRGCSTKKGDVFIIYDYMMNFSLNKMLYFLKKSFVLDWPSWYKIIKSLVVGFLYLHEEWAQTVVHKRITSANILLNGDLNPRHGGFELAEILNQDDDSHHSIVSVRGIFSYMSPEYMVFGKPMIDVDVFSFNVVALEMASDHRAID